jgi:hypothetical protein
MTNVTNRDPALCRAFVEIAKHFLDTYPTLKHSWSIDSDEDHCILEIFKVEETGFDISIHVSSDEITLFCEGFHEHYKLDDEPKKFVNQFLGLTYDLLTPSMRLREFLRGSSPYKWSIESLDDDVWTEEASSSLLFYNYFGQRSERFYQNKILEIRNS